MSVPHRLRIGAVLCAAGMAIPVLAITVPQALNPERIDWHPTAEAFVDGLAATADNSSREQAYQEHMFAEDTYSQELNFDITYRVASAEEVEHLIKNYARGHEWAMKCKDEHDRWATVPRWQRSCDSKKDDGVYRAYLTIDEPSTGAVEVLGAVGLVAENSGRNQQNED